MEKDETDKSKADTIGQPKSNVDKKYLINTRKELSVFVGVYAYLADQLAELKAAEGQRSLSAKEADDKRKIEDFLEIYSGKQILIKVQDALAEEIAPVPWNYWEKRGIFFPKKSCPKDSISMTTLESGGCIVSTTADFGNKTVIYRGFIPAGVSKKDRLKFGELTNKIYLALICFQKAQIKKTDSVIWPHVTKSDLLKFLNYSKKQINRGGRVFKLIDLTLMTLANFTYEIKDKKTPGQVEKIGHILSWRRGLEGRGFYFKLNDEHTRLMLALARGEKIEGRYMGYPSWLLRGSLTDAKRGIFEKLTEFAGLKRPYPIFIKTILTKWAGLTTAEVSKKQSATALPEFLLPILNEAQDKDLIKGYSYEPKSVRNNNPLEWKILFSFHHRKKYFAVDNDLLAAMLEAWGQSGLFDSQAATEDRRDRKRKQFTAVIKKHGPAAVRRIFVDTEAEGETAFWRQIEKLKMSEQKLLTPRENDE